MSNFSKIDLGAFSDLCGKKEEGGLTAGKVCLKEKLDLTSCEISLNCAEPGAKAPFSHIHKQNEEIYIFIRGNGKMSVDGEEFSVSAGTCVRVAPAGCRFLENTGNGPLEYICIQAREHSLVQSLFEDGEKC